MKTFKEVNGTEVITEEVFNSLPASAKVLYEEVTSSVAPTSGVIAFDLANIDVRASQTRSSFVDDLPEVSFGLKTQFDRKKDDSGNLKNTYGILLLGEPVEATIKGVKQEVTSIMADLSEVLFVAKRDGVDLLDSDGMVFGNKTISYRGGVPTVR